MRTLTLFGLTIFFTSMVYCQNSEPHANLNSGELDSLITEYYNQGKYNDAIPVAEALVNNAKKVKDDSLKAYALNNLAILYEKLADYDRAFSFQLQAKELREKVLGKEHPDYAQSLITMASWHYHKGNYTKSLSLYSEAIDIKEKVFGKEHPTYFSTLVSLARLHKEIGNYHKALQLYLQVKDFRERKLDKEHFHYAIVLSDLAKLYQDMGNYDKSLLYALQSKDIVKKVFGKEHPNYASLLQTVAAIHKRMGNYDKALTLYLQSRDIREKVFGKEHSLYGTLLNDLASLYESIGNYDKALPLYWEANGIMKKVLGSEHPTYATTLNNLGGIYRRMGNYNKAFPFYIQSKDIMKKVLGEEHADYATILNNLAKLYYDTGNYDQALPFYLKAKTVREKVLGKKHSTYAASLNNIAGLHEKAGNFDKAMEVLQQAMNSTSTIQLPITFDENWSKSLLAAKYPSYLHLESMTKSLGIAYRLLEKDSGVSNALPKQIIVTDLANALMIKARNQVSSEKDKLRNLSQSHDWLQKSLTVLNAKDHAHKAFNLSDQNKSVLLLQATKSELAYRLGELPDSLVWHDRELLKTRSKLQAKLLEKSTEEEKSDLRNELNDVNHKIDKFVNVIENEYPKYYKIKYQQVDTKADEVQNLLDPNTALLEYVIGDSVVHIFCVDKEEVRWTKSFVSNKELKDRIKSLHGSLSDYELKQPYKEYTSNAYWFYQHLIAPVLKNKSNITNLIIVTDGELGHLPFETFLIEKAPDSREDYRGLHYLLNDYNVSYNYSATLWKENIEAPAPKNNGQILGVAANYDISLDTSMLSIRLPTDQQTRAEISPLPGAREEVKVLKEKYKGFFAFDTLASEKLVKAKASDFSILHFATHGILDSERPVLSSLAFTEDNDSSESNFWQAHEISKLRLNADLVVLSACETGYGKFEQGNGIASLARAFMYAGAPSLVVSLWQVRDVTTSKLMKDFYGNLDSSMKKDEALRKAKLQYIQSTEEAFVHPAYWAPFIVIGKTDAVEIKQKNNSMAWEIGIGVFALLAIVGFVVRKRVV